MVMLLRQKIVFRVMLLVVLVVLVILARGQNATPTMAQSQSVVLIDAGHGGVDGGATALNGVLEKDINLSIALKLRDMLRLCGVPVAMIRETDVSIHDADCQTIRQKKVSDMANRLKQYDAASLAVSIHQNHFSASQYSGVQVLYSSNHPQSRAIAEPLRERLISLTQPQNKRELKAATSSVYLLHRTKRPAVLVECGFLSNPTESEKLQTAVYQQQLSAAIAVGILEVYPIKE